MTRVSVVIPTRNGAATLPALLDALAAQRGSFSIQTVAVDSGSEDGTVEILRRRVDTLISINAGDFDHGLTRNLGTGQTTGEFVVLIVQDAVPASDTWLSALIAPLLGDARVAGTFARQIPHPGASAITRHYHAQWIGASSIGRVTALADAAELEALAPMARLDRCTFDNVCSCIRRSVWERHPFQPTAIAEDLEWARTVLLAGFRLEYVPAAAVMHSHDRPVRYEFARTFVLHRRLYELFQVRTIPSVPLLARAVASSLALHARCERDAGALVPSARGIALAFAWPAGQYLGSRAAVKRWNRVRFGEV
jgi:rhamnosyltransferase